MFKLQLLIISNFTEMNNLTREYPSQFMPIPESSISNHFSILSFSKLTEMYPTSPQLKHLLYLIISMV
jgi:hypothetical protein